MKTTSAKYAADRYLQLVAAFPLRPIRTQQSHADAVKVLISLDGKPEQDDDEADYSRTLALLIQDYERPRVSPMSRGTVEQRIKHLMEEQGMNGIALGEVIGSRTAASMILNGQRKPSKAHVAKLSARFGLGAGYFMDTGV